MDASGFLLKTFGAGLSKESHRLRIRDVTRSYERIFRLYDEKTIVHVGTACMTALNVMSDFLAKKEACGDSGSELEDRLIDWMREWIIIMLNPVFGEVSASGGVMVTQIAEMITLLTPASKTVTSHFQICRVAIVPV